MELQKIKIIIFFLLITACFSNCKEVPPNIIFEPNYNYLTTDTTFVVTDSLPTPQPPTLLIEEFSGVRCVNCPQANTIIQQIENQFPNTIIPVTIHAGFFSQPYPQSTHNFNTPEGTFIYNNLQPEAVPSACFNRKLIENQTLIPITNKNIWQQLAQNIISNSTAPPINLYLNKNYNPQNRQLNLAVQWIYNPTALIFAHNDTLFLSVMLLENNLKTSQATYINGTETIDSQYIHQHILRKMLTPATGYPILPNPIITANTTTIKTFEIPTLPDTLNQNNIEIIAFLHTQSTNKKEIINTKKIKLQ